MIVLARRQITASLVSLSNKVSIFVLSSSGINYNVNAISVKIEIPEMSSLSSNSKSTESFKRVKIVASLVSSVSTISSYLYIICRLKNF